MTFIDYSHNQWLVAASLFVALIAGFTGLSLTQGLSRKTVFQRKLSISLAAIALGGGIWSMHFVAMLGLQMPILFYYDAAITMLSALVAILLVGIALLILHFRERTAWTLTLAGLLVGCGILAMHYIGMAGLQLCQALYTPTGILTAIVASCALNIAAFWIAYGNRSHRNVLLGTLCFGLAVFTVHFVAIGGTGFISVPDANEIGPLISNELLAMGVVLSSFLLCAAFLLTSITFLAPAQSETTKPDSAATEDQKTVAQAEAPQPAEPETGLQQVPYRSDGRTLFCDSTVVAAIRAEGSYTQIYTDKGKFFCAWSITEAEKRLANSPFLRTHRSFLINPNHVTGFERMKDNGVCYFETPGLTKAPVSRSRMKHVRAVLGV